MRIDDAGPRTRLLAGVAAWTVLAWLLALAGMGGRVDRLADDPDLLVPLPQATVAQPALGPPDQYLAIAERPLFASDRSPHPFFLEGGDEQAPAEAFDYVLTSVLLTPGTRLAIVRKQDGGEPLRVKLDEPLAQSGWRLVGLAPRGAVFEGPQGRRELELQVFDGGGGEPASAALEAGRTPQPAQAPAPVARPAVATPAAPTPRPAPPVPGRPSDQPGSAGDKPPPGLEVKPAEPTSTSADPAQAQMDSIRQRIEARRAALRKEER